MGLYAYLIKIIIIIINYNRSETIDTYLQKAEVNLTDTTDIFV